jgi:hypothetical protein
MNRRVGPPMANWILRARLFRRGHGQAINELSDELHWDHVIFT